MTHRAPLLYPIGFPQAPIPAPEIPPGGRGIVASVAACDGRPVRFVVPGSIAGKFRITQIEIGGRPQLGENDAIDCAEWTENSIKRGLPLSEILTDQIVKLDVENVGTLPEVFRAVLLCEVERST